MVSLRNKLLNVTVGVNDGRRSRSAISLISEPTIIGRDDIMKFEKQLSAVSNEVLVQTGNHHVKASDILLLLDSESWFNDTLMELMLGLIQTTSSNRVSMAR